MSPPFAGRASILVVLAVLAISGLRSSLAISQPPTLKDAANGGDSKQAVDDILKDTMLLLDALDQKLISVQNKTPSALMRDNLRLLEGSQDEQSDWSRPPPDSSLDERLLSQAKGRAELQLAASTFTSEDPSSSSSSKQPRQLMEENQLASDSAERHIKFTLDLMQASFASQTNHPSMITQTSSSKSATTNPIDSFLISPLSIQMVLMMMHLGARGQTRRELANILHLAADRLPLGQPQQLASQAALLEAGSGKLKRKNQTSAEAKLRQAQRQQAAAGAAISGAHDTFGSALRNLLKDPGVSRALTSANQLFLQKNLQLAQQYEWAIKNYYAAEIKSLDFQHQKDHNTNTNNTSPQSPSESPHLAANISLSSSSSSSSSNTNAGPDARDLEAADAQQVINDWIERQSRGKISNFLTSAVPASTLLMAINVIYFKGDWQYKFDPADTEQDAWFTQANGRQVKLPMMVNRLPLAFAHDAAMRTSVIELPYRAQRLGLFLLLPDEISGIFHTMQMLNSSSFAHLISSMRKPSGSNRQPVGPPSAAELASGGINIRIPKFSIESSPRLSQILSQQLGLKSLFAADLADLTGMFAPLKRAALAGAATGNNRTLDEQPPQVGLDELIHKAVLQVDEQGSVAAATSATIVERVGTFNGNYFEADHPFLLFLMDKQTGLVLFSGLFAGPNNQQDPLGSACKRTTISSPCT